MPYQIFLQQGGVLNDLETGMTNKSHYIAASNWNTTFLKNIDKYLNFMNIFLKKLEKENEPKEIGKKNNRRKKREKLSHTR